MPAGIVLAGGRSRRMGAPKASLDWHGSTLLHRVCGLVARGTGGPVVVVRAPGQELPPLPDGVRVVEDARPGRGPLEGVLAGLQATDADVAFVAAVDLPLLHPEFVAAVCRAGADADIAVPHAGGSEHPFAAAYRPALAPLLAELVETDRIEPAELFARSATRVLEALPHLESLRDVNERAEYDAALALAQPRVRARRFGPDTPPATELHAATLGVAAAAMGVTLDDHLLGVINGDQIARDPLEPLAEGDEVAFMAADAAG